MKSDRIYPFLVVAILLMLAGSGVLAYVFFRALSEERGLRPEETGARTSPDRPAGVRPGWRFGTGGKGAPGGNGDEIKWGLRKPAFSPFGVGPHLDGWSPEDSGSFFAADSGLPTRFDELCEEYGGEFSLLADGSDINVFLTESLFCLDLERPTVFVEENQKKIYKVGGTSYSACDLDRDLGMCVRFGEITPHAQGRAWHPVYAPTPRRPREATNIVEEWHAPFIGLTVAETRDKDERPSHAAGADGVSARVPVRNNYFLSSNPREWFGDLPYAATATMRDIQPGVDMSVYADQNRLEYVFTFWPGVDPIDVEFTYDSADAVRLLDNGNLAVDYECATWFQHRAAGFRWMGDEPIPLYLDYFVSGNTVRFEFPEEFEDFPSAETIAMRKKRRPQPLVEHLSFLGGEGDDRGYVVATDGRGNAYVAGSSTSPVFGISDASEPPRGENVDVFVTKYRLSDRKPLYTTLIGGRHEERAFGMVADSAGNAYICGETLSPDFATITPPAGNVIGRAWDAFVVKLDPKGQISDFAFRLGGDSDDHAYGIALDSATNIHVVGVTRSSNFPVTNAPAGLTRADGADAFVAKFDSSGKRLLYSVCLGGSKDDFAYGLALDSLGWTTIAGETHSKNFPVVNPFQAKHGGGNVDAFVARLKPDGSGLAFATYLGGQNDDRALGVDVDLARNILVTGETASEDFPTKDPVQERFAGGDWDAFVAKLPPDGAGPLYATYLGASGNDRALDVVADVSGRAFVAGTSSSTNLPLVNAVQGEHNGGTWDAFIARIEVDGARVDLLSYLGGEEADTIRDVALEAGRNLLMGGFTESDDLALVKPIQSIHRGGINDALVGRLLPEMPRVPPLRLVPAGGQVRGPFYDFYMSKYEIRNSEFVRFLNDAQANLDNERGTNMTFDARGNVWISPERVPERDEMFTVHDSRIIYKPEFPVGARYHVTPKVPADGGRYGDHPVVGVSWFGAVKYCNWITIDSGRGVNQRCYREGTNILDWAPITSAPATWEQGVFTGEQRFDWLAYKGFRLPMDNSEAPSAFAGEFFRVTNDEFTDFLNDTEANPDELRSANMFFDEYGNVAFEAGSDHPFKRLYSRGDGPILYNPARQLGQRFSVIEPIRGAPDVAHQVVSNVTWYGAMKYCNWLSLLDEIDAAQRAYREGTDVLDWAPSTCSPVNWRDGEFTETERKAWVKREGYRLPYYSAAAGPPAMDAAQAAGSDAYALLSYPNPFNEFLKAAGWNGRTNVYYGFGRDELDHRSGNYLDSRAPGVRDTTPAGYYDGTDHKGHHATLSNENFYGIHDLSGNATEWLSDPGQHGSTKDRACYGGSWLFQMPSVSQRFYVPPHFTDNFRGFRVVTTAASEDMHVARVPFRLCVCGYGAGAGCGRGVGKKAVGEERVGVERKRGKGLDADGFGGAEDFEGVLLKGCEEEEDEEDEEDEDRDDEEDDEDDDIAESPGDDVAGADLVAICHCPDGTPEELAVSIVVPFAEVNEHLLHGDYLGRCLDDILTDGGLVQVCHNPSGEPGSEVTLVVPTEALQAHLDHGDSIGRCPGDLPPPDELLRVCHCPEGTDPADAETIWITGAELQFHLDHGDYYGICAKDLPPEE